MRKTMTLLWLLVFCFLTNSSFATVKQESFKETKQILLPPCFSYFENLYFDATSWAFFALGTSSELDKAIYVPEKRGYVWKNYRNMPLRLTKKGFHSVPEVTIILLERNATPFHSLHFFHILEHLIGIWSFGGEQNRNAVKLVLMAGNGAMHPPEIWKGANDIPVHLIKALFPNAEIKSWSDFIHESNNGDFQFEKVLISDRCMEYYKREPYYTERMLGEYYQYLSTESLDHLAFAVHDYAQVEKQYSEKLVVTYVRRPPPVRRSLQPMVEKELFAKIQQLPDVELRIVDFAGLPFKEQINIVANTDVLLGIHGNGLSHALFLPKGATLIELFPKNCLRVEYRIFANSRKLDYYGMISGNGWIDNITAEKLGVFGEHINAQIDTLDIDAIISVLQNCKKSQRT